MTRVVEQSVVAVKLLAQVEDMSRLLHHHEPGELLQLPLVLENQVVPAGAPPRQVLLAPHVRRTRVQHTALTPLGTFAMTSFTVFPF